METYYTLAKVSTDPLRETVNTGLLISYDGYKVVSNPAYFAGHVPGKSDFKVLHCYIERSNKQWITLKFNSLVLAILNLKTEENNLISAMQVYGKAETLDEATIHKSLEAMRVHNFEYEISAPEFEAFIKEYASFKIIVDKTVQAYSMRSPF
jgi:hypothetical protein